MALQPRPGRVGPAPRRIELVSIGGRADRSGRARVVGMQRRASRSTHGGPLGDRVTPHPEDEVLKRQRDRARLMAWLLGAFVILLFLITVAKIGLNK